MIYLDSASTSYYKPDAVIQAVVSAISEIGNSGRGGQSAALAASRLVYEARVGIGELFGAETAQVAFTHSATFALNAAIFGLLSGTDHVITTVLEHNSVLRPLYHLQKSGLAVDFVGLTDNKDLDYAAFAKLLRKNTKCVIVTHCSNVTGLAVDLDFVAAFCKRHGLIFIIDAAQSAGILLIDVKKFDHTVLCFTGHKGLFGPQGTGGMVINGDIKIPPIIHGGSGNNSFLEHQPENFPESLEAGTPNAHGIAGLAAGVGYIKSKGLDAINAESIALAAAFREGMKGIPGIKIFGNFALPHIPIVSINIGGLDSAEGEALLDARGLCVRGGFHCAPLMHKALGTAGQGALRFSFSSFNTPKQVEKTILIVDKIAREYS